MLLVAQFGLVTLYAQPIHPHFTQIADREGLPSNEVYCALQDSAGYIWFGTDNGIARFDGYDFEVFNADHGLEDLVVFKMVLDEEGGVWASTYSGRIYKWADGRFEPFRYNDRLLAIKADRIFLYLLEARVRDGTMLLRSGRDDIFHLDSSGVPSPVFSPERANISVFNLGDENRIARGQTAFNGFSYSGEPGSAVYEYAYSSSTDHVIYESEHIFSFPDDLNKRTSLFLTHPGSEDTIVVDAERLAYRESAAWITQPLPTRKLNYAAAYSDSSFLIGYGAGAGLYHLRKNEDENAFELQVLLPDHSISSWIVDRRGGLWVTTLDAGIYYSADPSTRVYNHWTGIGSSKILSITAVDSMTFFSGHEDGSIFLYHEGSTPSRISNESSAEENKQYRTYFDRSSNQLIGANRMYRFTSGLERAQSGGISFKTAFGQRLELIKKVTPNLFSTNGGSVDFLGLRVFGQMDLSTNTIDPFFSISGAQKRDLTLHSYCRGSDGRHWLGTLQGLYTFDPTINDLIPYSSDIKALSNRIEEIHNLPDSALLLGTRGYGLIYKKDHLTHIIDHSDGLASNMIRDLHLSPDGEVWVATLSGASQVFFDFDHLTDDGVPSYSVQTFGLAHGLPSEEIYDIGTTEGFTWMATAEGVVRFKKPDIDLVSHSPYIERLLIGGAAGNTSRPVVLKPKENNLSIHFKTLDFAARGRILYRYRLSESQSWNLTRQTQINLPSLVHGSYRFEVQSQNRDGYWSESTLLPFQLMAPWYLRWYSVVGFFLTTCAGGYLAIKQRDRRKQRESSLNDQVRELEKAALQAQMNPHFIFNSLNSIEYFILKNDKKKAVYYLSTFADLIRDNLRTSVVGKHSLAQEIRMLENYLSLEKMRFKDELDYEIVDCTENSSAQTIIPAMLIQPIVENAIKHGISQTDRRGWVKIVFSGNQDKLEVRITDNGRGFLTATGDVADPRKSKSEKDWNRYKKSNGLGMDITRKRLNLLQRETMREKNLHFFNHYHPDGTVAGAEVVLIINTPEDEHHR
ncbi:MAG: histidine kinase [Bacteroidota bacterium]